MIIHLHDRRVVAADLVSKLQHATAGFPLLLVGVSHFTDEAERPVAILEIVIAVLVLITFAREVVAAAKHHSGSHAAHSAVGWFDIAAAGMLMFEAFHGAHHKPGYLRPQFLAAVTTLGLGLFHGRLHAMKKKRRYVKLDETGVEVRTGPFRKIKATWGELRSIHLSDHRAVFHRNDGRRHTIGLRLLANRDDVRQALHEHARAAGVTTEGVS
jgi:hypothetical protein